MCHHTAPSMSYTRSIRPKYWCTGCCFYTGRECWCCHSRGFQSEERTWLLNKSRTRSWIFDESKFLRPDSVRTVMRFWWDCQISASNLWMRFSTKVKAFLENVWKLACSEPVQEFYISKNVALVYSPPLSKGHECLCSLFVHVVSLKPGFKSTDTDRRVEYYIVVTMDHVFKMNHVFKKQNSFLLRLQSQHSDFFEQIVDTVTWTHYQSNEIQPCIHEVRIIWSPVLFEEPLGQMFACFCVFI